jgi:DNA ligase (NAD+)
MTDEQFDMRLEDLKQFERETGFVLSNSPTINVGAKVLTELEEAKHSRPMLSLDKCHTIEEIVKFANDKEITCKLNKQGQIRIEKRYTYIWNGEPEDCYTD